MAKKCAYKKKSEQILCCALVNNQEQSIFIPINQSETIQALRFNFAATRLAVGCNDQSIQVYELDWQKFTAQKLNEESFVGSDENSEHYISLKALVRACEPLACQSIAELFNESKK